uniref:Putative secreted metalloprotease n=1 Tax=Ixodes ricinus TaxID=34613 RepID=A0A6B0VDJ4_IXORI
MLLTMLEVYTVALLCAIIHVNVDCAPFPENIVYPKLLEARGIKGQKVLHIKDGLTLTLEKLSVLADSLVFTESNDGVATETIMNGTELEKPLYRDRAKMAAVALEEKHSSIEVMGVLSDKLRIAPWPFMARSDEGHLAHRIYEVEPSMNHEENYADTPPEKPARTKRRTRATSMNHVPDEFFVEVHMMVDQNHYNVFENKKQLATYLALNIALVNMRYEDTSSPKIQFLLTSIQKEEEFTKRFLDNDVDWPEAERIYANANATFENLLKNYGKSPADITVAVTGLLLADYDYDRVDIRVQGQARLGGVCNASYSILMVEDVPLSYGMVSRLPHELGHALGAPHDGDIYVWNTALPPKLNCSASGRFIMNPYQPGNGKFSNCSKKHMTAFISTLKEDCFKFKAEQNCTTEMKVLPGASINLTEICIRAHPNLPEWNLKRTDDLSSSCLFGCSSSSPVGEIYMEEPLPDGAECGGGKRCVRGNCDFYDEHGTPLESPPGANITTL